MNGNEPVSEYLLSPSSSSFTIEPHRQQRQKVEDALHAVVSTLQLSDWRRRRPLPQDADMLRALHNKLFAIVEREPRTEKRQLLKKALMDASNIRLIVLGLRENLHFKNETQTTANSCREHLRRLLASSFDDENYRKAASVLGMVEAVAEILILDVAVWGTTPTDRMDGHREVRKLAAIALTNFTYGQAHSKRLLCQYSGFVDTVVLLIERQPSLVQVLAGLIRNLSCYSDEELGRCLAPTVRPLARAALRASKRVAGEKDDACLRACLAALWNLALTTFNNRQVLYEEKGFVDLLCLLFHNSSCSEIVKSAAGILQCVSQYPSFSRASRASPNYLSLTIRADQRSSSLPRHFAHDGGFVPPPPFVPPQNFSFASQKTFFAQQRTPDLEENKTKTRPFIEDQYREMSSEAPLAEEEDLTESLQGSRCTTAQSLNDEVPNMSGWESVLDTAENSARLSPVSLSDLPDSPTHYSTLRKNSSKVFQAKEASKKKSDGLLAPNMRSASPSTPTFDPFEEPTPTFSQLNLPQPVSSPSMTSQEFANRDCGVFSGSSDLLLRSIEAALPPSRHRLSPSSSRKGNELTESLPTALVEAAQPRPLNPSPSSPQSSLRHFSSSSTIAAEYLNATGGGDEALLLQAIASAMPQASSPCIVPTI